MSQSRRLTQLPGVAVVVAALAVGCSGQGPTQSAGEQVSGDPSSGGDFYECMANRAWDLEPDSNDEFTIQVPSEQNDQYLDDFMDCAEIHGHLEPPRMSREEAERFYDEMVTTTECLIDLGYPAPEPASREATVDALMNGGLPAWNPYDYVNDTVTSMSQLNQIEEACPRPTGAT